MNQADTVQTNCTSISDDKETQEKNGTKVQEAGNGDERSALQYGNHALDTNHTPTDTMRPAGKITGAGTRENFLIASSTLGRKASVENERPHLRRPRG